MGIPTSFWTLDNMREVVGGADTANNSDGGDANKFTSRAARNITTYHSTDKLNTLPETPNMILINYVMRSRVKMDETRVTKFAMRLKKQIIGAEDGVRCLPQAV